MKCENCIHFEVCFMVDPYLPVCGSYAEPVKHGRWETDQEDVYWGNSLKRKHCTNCKKRPHFDKEEGKFILSDYCPNCGAKMGVE